jgi:hypothetical protein
MYPWTFHINIVDINDIHVFYNSLYEKSIFWVINFAVL